jgi:hypothetical protein
MGSGNSYLVYLVLPGASSEVADSLREDLRMFADDRTTAVERPGDPEQLLHAVHSQACDILLLAIESFTETEWTTLDRRRSALAREGVTVVITTAASFEALMHVAPNLASWLGGGVFTHKDLDEAAPAQREQRLEALRAWSGKTDEEVRRAAMDGSLPRDPEYAEWLVLLGHGDLLDG